MLVKAVQLSPLAGYIKVYYPRWNSTL